MFTFQKYTKFPVLKAFIPIIDLGYLAWSCCFHGTLVILATIFYHYADLAWGLINSYGNSLIQLYNTLYLFIKISVLAKIKQNYVLQTELVYATVNCFKLLMQTNKRVDDNVPTTHF